MIIVPGTEEILHLVGVQGLIHRNREDVLDRGFVEYGKIGFVIRFQTIAHFLQLVTVCDHRLPGIETVAVYLEKYIFSIRALSVRPIIVCINFGVQSQFGQ